MPQGHPPVEIPEDVRKVIAKLADAARAKPDDLETWQQLGFVQYKAGQVDAKYLADASFYANQIIGEMWVNRTNLANYAYAGGGGPPAALANWVTSVQNGLPGVTGAVNQPTVAVAGTTVTVTVFWQPPAATAPHRHVTIAYING